MKKCFITLSMIFLSVGSLLAQIPTKRPAGFPGGFPGKFQGAPPKIGHLFGKIIDSADGKPTLGVSVILLQQKYDTATHKFKPELLQGQVTKENGEFDFEGLPIIGRLELRISYLGYNSIQIPISFIDLKAMKQNPKQIPNFDKDLGKIIISPNSNMLKEVKVTANVPLMKLEADKKVFNVSKNIVSAGGTAVDVMKNVPSVLVDADGNVTIRNKTPQIYVEGRPTTLTLDEIPADAIQSIEVITNPSAKYDASGGGAGIINIVLKKDRKQGINGNILGGVDSRGGFNAGGGLNIRQGKVNVSANLMSFNRKSKTTGVTNRTNFFDNPETTILQNNNDINNGGFIFGRLGLDYFLNNKTTLSIGGLKAHGQFGPNENIFTETDSLFPGGTTSNQSFRNTTGKREFNFGGIQLDLVQLFKKDGEKLTADLSYNQGKTNNLTNYYTDYYLKDTHVIQGVDQEKLQGNGNISFFTFQTDYELPTKNSGKFETGIRASINNTLNNSNNSILDSTGNYAVIPLTVDDYKNTSSVYAAYLDYSGKIKKNFAYEAGLRAESSNYNGELTNKNETFANKYPISLFPSVFMTQSFKNNQQLQVSYTRRINRPNFFQLLPFTDYSDNLNITRGNPNLVPEFTNSFELNYSKTFKRGDNILISGYYKETNNLITRYLETGVDPLNGSTILINTFINANSSDDYGFEFTSQNFFTKWWDATLDLNVYNSEINISNIDTLSQNNSMVSWFGKLSNNFKVGHGFNIQLSGIYQSKTNLPVNNQTGFGGGGPGMQAQSSSQGYIKGNYEVDLAIQKYLLKNNAASLTLSINDIFRSRRFDQYSFSTYFNQDYTQITNPQLVRLTFNFHFGKVDATLFKRKNMKAQGQGMQNASQEMSF